MDGMRVNDRAGCGLQARARSDADGLGLRGEFEVICRGADGEEKWRERVPNLVVFAGRNAMLDTWFSGSAYTASPFVGLKGSGTPNQVDTMSSHATWAEIVPYSDATRPAYVAGAASAGSISNTGSPAVFNINATATVAGCFITTNSTKSGTSGTLFAATDFASARGVISGDTLNVTYTLNTN